MSALRRLPPNLQNGDLFGIWSRLARPIVRLALGDEKESSLGTKKQGRTYIVRLQGHSFIHLGPE